MKLFKFLFIVPLLLFFSGCLAYLTYVSPGFETVPKSQLAHVSLDNNMGTLFRIIKIDNDEERDSAIEGAEEAFLSPGNHILVFDISRQMNVESLTHTKDILDIVPDFELSINVDAGQEYIVELLHTTNRQKARVIFYKEEHKKIWTSVKEEHILSQVVLEK